MRHRRSLAWLLGLLVALGALPAAAEDDSPDLLPSVGRGYFEEHCAVCHGMSGRGDGPAAQAMEPRPADLTGIAGRNGGSFPASDVAMKIDGRFELPAHGSRAMPIWGRELAPSGTDPSVAEEIARGRILTLVEYLRTIQAVTPKPMP